MKFLTEADLRAQYRISAFLEYRPEPGTRLTPGARQFLNDRGVKIGGGASGKRAGDEAAGAHFTAGTAEYPAPGGAAGEARAGELKSHKAPQLALRSVQAMFLQAGADLMAENVLTAKEIFELERVLAAVGAAGEISCQGGNSCQSGNSCGESLSRPDAGSAVKCAACEGIGPENAGELLEDCFEITGFHARAERGREIVRLHGLRCALRQLEPELMAGQRETIHRVINRLSQMICGAFGGTICQRNG